MSDSKPYRYLNTFMAKQDVVNDDFETFLSPNSNVILYPLDQQYGFDGALYVKASDEKRPQWCTFVDTIAGTAVSEIGNKSSSAVLFIRAENNLFAFTFGYGRFLVNLEMFVHDFGLKTALNTLNHESLRSVDLHTIDDQPVQKKSQAARESQASVFGIDISKDVLRAVTGSPKKNVNFKNISGGDAVFSFGIEMDIEELPELSKMLTAYYSNDEYKSQFSWVDNIRRIKERALLSRLDEKLIEAIKSKDDSLIVTLPEIAEWDSIFGFSFTRSKTTVTPTIDGSIYFSGVDEASLSIDSIKRDRLFVFDVHENEFNHSMYKCVYLEVVEKTKTYMIFGGVWYEIDNLFIGRINSILGQIKLSDLEFPAIETWEEGDKMKIETEGDYNIRAADEHGYFLLDKKLVKSNKTTSSIELCDLLTSDKQFIHVKHRKGGSAGLSHLFAQGNVSAEIMLGDKEFRKAARKVLNKVHRDARDLVPLDNLRSINYEIVFLILGEKSDKVKENLPFFSKVNLSKAYDNLSQRGFSVKISGAEKVPRVIKGVGDN